MKRVDILKIEIFIITILSLVACSMWKPPLPCLLFTMVVVVNWLDGTLKERLALIPLDGTQIRPAVFVEPNSGNIWEIRTTIRLNSDLWFVKS